MSQPFPLLAARQHAQALADSGDLGQARAVLEHAVDLGRANLGEDDPEVLRTAQQLAAVHQRADDPSAARRLLEEAYAAGQWRLGDADPVMVGISFDLGVVAEEMENRHEARRAFGRVVAHGPAALGADHWAVVRARSYLGEGPPTVRMELPAEQPQHFQVPPQRAAVQDQQAPARPQQAPAPSPPVAEPAPRYFPEQPSPQQQDAPFHTSVPPSFGPANTTQPAPPSFGPVNATQPAPPHFGPVNATQPAPPRFGPGATTHPTPPNVGSGAAAQPAPPVYPQPAVSHSPPGYPESAPPQIGGLPGIGYAQPEPGYYERSHPEPRLVSAPPAPPAKGSEYSRKAPAIFAAIAAVFGVIIAVVALVVVLANRDDDPASDVPTLSGPAPSDVRMRDYGSSVKLSWADPANGRASFVVTGGRPGEQLRPMGQVGPTSTSFDLNGLNADLDYCFAVVAVYTTTQFSTSPQICTNRTPRSGRPTPTKR